MGFKRVITASSGLALVLAILVGLMIYNHLGSLARTRRELAHTHEVIEANQGLFALVQDAESGQRGFLLTENPSYLRPYEQAKAALGPAQAHLRELVIDNPGQADHVAQLDDAIAARMAPIDRSVALASAGDFAAARAVVATGGGDVAMRRIRDRASVINAAERILLEKRQVRAAAEERNSLAIGVALGALALGGLLYAVWNLARGNRDLQRAMNETRAAQTAQAASEALAGALFENTPDYLLVLGVEPDGRLTLADMNPALERVLRTSAGALRDRPLDELMPGAGGVAVLDHYRRVRDSDAPVVSRDVIPFPDGPRTWESILAPVRDAKGRTTRIVGSIRDITDRVRAEEQLRAVQRMDAIGQLTGGVAHDFNNLLQVIRGNLELLQPFVEAEPRALQRLQNALFGADRAGQLTRQLLAFARRQPLAPQAINLSRLVSDMAELLGRTLGEAIAVETVVAAGLWNTLADPAQVESALLNLALNARDAMPGGGRLTIEITNAVLDEDYVRESEGLTAGQYVLLAVSDTGTGMDAATRARVFEPFFTTKVEGKGTGLGLAMVYGFVKQSNGHVQIYSEPGHGTTVKLYLPRSAGAAAALRPAEVAPVSAEGRLILVVEDEDAVRAAAVAMLEGLGYQCLEATDAASALGVIEAGAAVDLVFSDVVMPGPVKTRDFSARLRALAPDLPVLFTSGYTENAIVHHGRLDEGVALLSKPYTRNDLARKVAQMLAK